MAKRGGGIVYGPYKLEVRKDFLKRLLAVQKRVCDEGTNLQEELISKDELHAIRRLWRSEAQDWEDSVPKIVREVLGDVIDWPADEQAVFSTEDRKILDLICEKYDVPSAMVAKLLDVERQYHGMNRRSAIHKNIAAVLEEDWRSEEEVLAQVSELSDDSQ